MKGEVRARIVVAIAKARIWLAQLVRSEITDIEAISQRERRSGRSVSMALSLAFLAPDIVEAAVKGTLPPGLGLADLTDLPMDWAEQQERLGLR
jgi:site-specific DNA recombinase